MAKIIENHGLKCPKGLANLIIKDKKLQINRYYKYIIDGDEYMVRKSPDGKIHIYEVIDETDEKVVNTTVGKQGELIWGD